MQRRIKASLLNLWKKCSSHAKQVVSGISTPTQQQQLSLMLTLTPKRNNKNREERKQLFLLLNHLNPSTVVPRCQQRITLGTIMVNILKRRYHVRQTTYTCAETEHRSPSTTPVSIFTSILYMHRGMADNILCCASRFKLDPSHLALVTHRAVNRCRSALDCVQWCGCLVSAGVKHSRLQWLCLLGDLGWDLDVCLVWLDGGLACVGVVGRGSNWR